MDNQKNNKKTIRSRTYATILYTDDIMFNFRFEKIKKMDTVYILHDKDTTIIDNKKEIKKAHYHVLFNFTNARSINSLADELQLDVHYIDVVDSFKGYSRYLIHLDDKDKYQYSIEDIKGNLKDTVIKHITKNNTPTNVQCRAILDYIYSETYPVYYKNVLDYALLNGYHDYIIGRWYFFKSIIDEYNEESKPC